MYSNCNNNSYTNITTVNNQSFTNYITVYTYTCIHTCTYIHSLLLLSHLILIEIFHLLIHFAINLHHYNLRLKDQNCRCAGSDSPFCTFKFLIKYLRSLAITACSLHNFSPSGKFCPLLNYHLGK